MQTTFSMFSKFLFLLEFFIFVNVYFTIFYKVSNYYHQDITCIEEQMSYCFVVIYCSPINIYIYTVEAAY